MDSICCWWGLQGQNWFPLILGQVYCGKGVKFIAGLANLPSKNQQFQCIWTASYEAIVVNSNRVAFLIKGGSITTNDSSPCSNKRHQSMTAVVTVMASPEVPAMMASTDVSAMVASVVMGDTSAHETAIIETAIIEAAVVEAAVMESPIVVVMLSKVSAIGDAINASSHSALYYKQNGFNQLRTDKYCSIPHKQLPKEIFLKKQLDRREANPTLIIRNWYRPQPSKSFCSDNWMVNISFYDFTFKHGVIQSFKGREGQDCQRKVFQSTMTMASTHVASVVACEHAPVVVVVPVVFAEASALAPPPVPSPVPSRVAETVKTSSHSTYLYEYSKFISLAVLQRTVMRFFIYLTAKCQGRYPRMSGCCSCFPIIIGIIMQGESEVGGETMRIGHYVLGRTIGKGGFAKVKEARHQLTGLRVAVKIINKLKMKNKNMISKVTREVKILKFVSHPNIIKLYEVLDTTNDIFVVMEMAPGGELYEYIQHHDLPERDVRVFFQQIIEGVDHAHRSLVAHRDLKPENVLLDANRVVKVADFGLSNLMKDGRLLRTNCGSLNYAAPEIIGRRPYEGTALDVWSCGVILYTMLVGALPFDEEVVSLLYRKIETADYSIPDWVNPVAADLIARMLQVNPCRRIRVADIKLHPWLRREVPVYARLSFASGAVREEQFALDLQVLGRVRALNMASLRGVGDIERIGKIIRKRMDDSFVAVYELIKDQKDRHAHSLPHPAPSFQIFALLPNRLQRPEIEDGERHEFVFGRGFAGGARRVVEAVFEAFVGLEVEFSIKNNQYCLLCVYYPPSKAMRKRSDRVFEEDKIYGYQDEHRFTKQELKFTLQLYARAKNTETLVDLKLSQGHPFVFIAFARKLYRRLQDIVDLAQ